MLTLTTRSKGNHMEGMSLATVNAKLDMLLAQQQELLSRVEALEKTKRSQTFQVPTLEQIQQEIDRLELPVDAQAFFDHWQAKNWYVKSGVRLKDMASALRNAHRQGWAMSTKAESKRF